MTVRSLMLAAALSLSLAAPAAALEPVGSQMRVSHSGPDGVSGFPARAPAVAHDADHDRYLAVWAGQLPNGKYEVFSRRYAGDGTPLGGQFRISFTGAEGNVYSKGLDPEVAYNPKLDEFLVVWQADLAPDADGTGEYEIHRQRWRRTASCSGRHPRSRPPVPRAAISTRRPSRRSPTTR